MGNILCRDKSPRRVYVKGPLPNGANYDPHLFQADSLVNGTKKNNEPNNPIFYSTPNLNTSDMKSTISLDARIFDSGNFQRPPVAPPRKKKGTLKKGSTLPATFSNDKVRNGFKDVFGNNSVSSSNNFDDIDYIDKEENSLHERATSTPEKKLRVGNKKSDKFFGESLSDRISDEPISDEPISPISKNKDESVDPKSETDKKLSFFLMNMLDDIRDLTEIERYKGREPVEEPPFVAKKREIKHICDDDDHIHEHIHGHKKHENDNIAPPKPDRDFSKLKQADNENVVEIQTVNAEKLPEKDVKVVKRGISRENLPSPPATPQRKSGVTSPPSTPVITIDTTEIITSPKEIPNTMTNTKLEEKKEEKIESPKEITETVDDMIKKAYGIGDFHPEDHSHDTHDEVVTPTSKLAIRKISTPRKISTASTSDHESLKSSELAVPTSPFKKTSFCTDPAKLEELLEESHRKFDHIDELARIPKSPVLSDKREKISVGSSMNDIIDEIYSKNSEIMQEFQTFLEQSLEKEPVINVEEEKKFVESKKTLGEDEKDICLQKDHNEDGLEDCSYSDSFESSDEEPEVRNNKVNVANEITNNHLKRNSIEQVDNWFSRHVEMEETESDVLNSARNELQRPTSYDTQKIFPFGPTITDRRDSLSDEFFIEHPILSRIKTPIETVRESESSISEDGEAKEKAATQESRESSMSRDSNKSKSPDHSTLLKYFDNSIKESEKSENNLDNKKQ
ncbi:hypothetical protein PVAND_009617 [Polypedilum vanderplanki]|uniref:Uncharacterized protein n=1 Tax=Polypedilum vanderplanki TaxID=319348 RepID=A0A9J6CE86_POLVA|nr:hypothetical protein PVAND_009617 [Polypedilum vanderplanki]